MRDQKQNHHKKPSNKGLETKNNETFLSRWASKPEQVLILESIFNRGMVYPSNEETVKLRKHLEKFGAVKDANVFYWFQNRRSSHGRLKRFIQATIKSKQTQSRSNKIGSTSIPNDNNFFTGFAPATTSMPLPSVGVGSGFAHAAASMSPPSVRVVSGFAPATALMPPPSVRIWPRFTPASMPSPSMRVGSSSSCGDHDENYLVFLRNYFWQQNIEEKSGDDGGSSIVCGLDSRNSSDQYGD